MMELEKMIDDTKEFKNFKNGIKIELGLKQGDSEIVYIAYVFNLQFIKTYYLYGALRLEKYEIKDGKRFSPDRKMLWEVGCPFGSGLGISLFICEGEVCPENLKDYYRSGLEEDAFNKGIILEGSFALNIIYNLIDKRLMEIYKKLVVD